MNTTIVLSLIYLFTFGFEKIEKAMLTRPQAISVDVQGNLYIADTGNHRILKFDSDLNFIKSIGGFGWNSQQFDEPVDICAKSILDIFIADYNNQRIERYDKDLNYISTMYSDDSDPENLQLGRPRSVFMSIHGELMIIDSENNRLLKINSFGEPIVSFGDFSAGKGKLDEPMQVEISRQDIIYVSDKTNSRIVVFDYFGNYLSDIGSGILQKPGGLCYDLQDRLWVADGGNKEIFLFDQQGELLLRWSSIDSTENKFKNPVDIVTFKEKVFVLDENRIHVFEIHFHYE